MTRTAASLAVAAGLLGLAAPGVAQAQPAQEPACGYVAVLPGVDSARIHAEPTLQSRVDGILYPGRKLPSPAVEQGGHRLCIVNGGSFPVEGEIPRRHCSNATTENTWFPVELNGQVRYVARCYTYWPPK